MSSPKTVLFFPMNSPGHINPSLGLADRLRDNHGFRAVFLVIGPMFGNSIREHKHELIQIEEENPIEDYPIIEGEDLMQPLDEEAKKKQGLTKEKFAGAYKWPHLIMRYRRIFRMDPIDTFLNSFEIFDKFMVSSLIDQHAKVEEILKTVKPDLVVIDAFNVPPCIVNMRNTPWMRLHSANPLMVIDAVHPKGLKPPPMSGYKLSTKEAREKMRKEEPEKWNAMIAEWQAVMTKMHQVLGQVGETRLDRFLKEHNCPPLEPGKQSHDSPHLNLYLFPKELDYDKDDDIFRYSPRWFGADSLIRKSIGQTSTEMANAWEEKVAEAMKGKKDMVYFSLGSVASADVALMRRYINIFKNDKERLYVISKGVNGDKLDLCPDNMIGGNYIPQTFFLDRASLAIIHGGNNSITECAYYGIPLIVLPMFGDQLDNAQRVEDLGFGRRLDAYESTEAELRQAIDEVLSNKEMQEKCRELGKSMRSRDDVQKISLIIKKLAEEGHLEQDFIDECRNKNVDEIKF